MKWIRQLLGIRSKFEEYVPEEVTQDSMARRLVHSTINNGWGNAIQFMSWEPDATGHRKIYGHKSHLEVGDWFAVELKSGKIGVLEVRELEWESDPPDMFFGKACDVGFIPEGTPLAFKASKPRFVSLASF